MMDRWWWGVWAALALAGAGCGEPEYRTGAGPAAAEADTCVAGPGPLPEAVAYEYELDPWFYTRHCAVYGVPVLGSAALSDEAMQEAGRIAAGVLSARKDLRDALHDRYLRIVVIASTLGERFTDVPELAGLTARETGAAGLGPTPDFPAVTVRDSVVLCRPVWQEPDVTPPGDTLVHELGHAWLAMGLEAVDRNFRARLERSYDQARQQATWRRHVPEEVAALVTDDLPVDNYMMTHPDEYWAVAVSSYLGFKPIRVGYGIVQQGSANPVVVNEAIVGPEPIEARDPTLAALLAEALPGPPVIEHHCPAWVE